MSKKRDLFTTKNIPVVRSTQLTKGMSRASSSSDKSEKNTSGFSGICFTTVHLMVGFNSLFVFTCEFDWSLVNDHIKNDMIC